MQQETWIVDLDKPGQSEKNERIQAQVNERKRRSRIAGRQMEATKYDVFWYVPLMFSVR